MVSTGDSSFTSLIPTTSFGTPSVLSYSQSATTRDKPSFFVTELTLSPRKDGADPSSHSTCLLEEHSSSTIKRTLTERSLPSLRAKPVSITTNSVCSKELSSSKNEYDPYREDD